MGGGVELADFCEVDPYMKDSLRREAGAKLRAICSLYILSLEGYCGFRSSRSKRGPEHAFHSVWGISSHCFRTGSVHRSILLRPLYRCQLGFDVRWGRRGFGIVTQRVERTFLVAGLPLGPKEPGLGSIVRGAAAQGEYLRNLVGPGSAEAQKVLLYFTLFVLLFSLQASWVWGFCICPHCLHIL